MNEIGICELGFDGCEGVGELLINPANEELNGEIIFQHICPICYAEVERDV